MYELMYNLFVNAKHEPSGLRAKNLNTIEEVPDAEELPEDEAGTSDALERAVVLKLNGGLGTSMMKRVMKQNRMPGVAELMEMAKDLGVQFIACTTTLGLMGISKDTLIEGVDQFAGVSTYLAEAKDAQVNLFI